MNESIKISIIGKGNVAIHLYRAFTQSSIIIRSIFARTHHVPVDIPKALFRTDANLRNENVDLVILAVSDRAIKDVLTNYKFPKNAIVVHTAGSIGMDVFNDTGIGKHGVIYPLLSFSVKRNLNYQNIPILIEANDASTSVFLSELASKISAVVIPCDSSKRLKVHTAAVFANNFSNLLFSISSKILSEVNLELKLLEPLLLETVEKAIEIGPDQAQTGPAIRNDLQTMNKHLEALENDEIRHLYKTLSDYIRKSQTDT